VVLLISLGALGVYRTLFAGGAQLRDSRVRRARASHEQLAAERERAEDLARRAERTQIRLERLYGSRFKTQEQRITKVIAEVKELAVRAGLDPPTIHYPDEPIRSYGLVKRSIVFGVDGTYLALRRFINFLELTDSFVTLEEIRPSERSSKQGSRLSINLRVSTLFLDEGIDPAALARDRDTVGDRR
jgi:hypothetical protein